MGDGDELLGECVALNLIISTVKVFLLLAEHQWEAEAGETQMLGQSEQHVRPSVRVSYFEVGR